jgi:pantetheine-phosphate adenylyltransferase
MTQPARIAVFPGSFDPFTTGHAEIAERSAALFDRVVVAILINPGKTPMFSVDDRVSMIREAMAGTPNVDVDTFEGLLVDYAASRGASAVVRGLRSGVDFEYEMQMALMNRHLRPATETVFLASSASRAFVSSRLVRDIILHGGDAAGLVPEPLVARLRNRRRGGTTRQA